MNYILHILIMINIYVILSLSLNLLVGYSGLLSVAHAAFYAIGAYTTVLLMKGLGINFFIAIPVGICVAILLSVAVSVPLLRLRGDYFVLGTLGFQNIVYGVLYNWVGLTRGPYGISGIPAPRIMGFEIQSIPELFILSGFLALLALAIMVRIGRSPFGRLLKAIREDELAAEGLGKNISAVKTQAFMISAAIASIAGGLFAVYARYIDPTSFTIYESIFIISIVLVGGSGNIKGPIVGAVILVMLPEILRFLKLPDAVAANVRQIIYGALLILLMRFRPQGIAGEYRFD